MTTTNRSITESARRFAGLFGRSIAGAFLGAWVLFSILLLLWLVIAAFKENNTVLQDLFALPKRFAIGNFSDAWGLLNLDRTFMNSVLVVGTATAGTLVLSAPAAYAISRFKFPGVGLLTVTFAVGIGIPTQVLIIPLFVGLAKLHLTNSLVGLTIIYIGISIPFAVFLLTAFFVSLPKDLEDAALVDGAGPVRAFRSIMLPLARAGIITTAIFTAVGLWNEFLLALTFIIDDDKRTLSLTLLNTYGAMRYTSNWVGLFAAVIIIVLPILILYVLLSRQIIEGITLGSSK